MKIFEIILDGFNPWDFSEVSYEKARQFWAVAPNLMWSSSSPRQPRLMEGFTNHLVGGNYRPPREEKQIPKKLDRVQFEKRRYEIGRKELSIRLLVPRPN